MPIQSVPVDQAAFTKFQLVEVEAKTDRETGVQFTTKDGSARKWVVHVVAIMPSRFDSSRTDKEVLPVTVTSSADPSELVSEGDLVEFDGLTVGVMNPEAGDDGRIRGGKLFWGASGVRSRVTVRS